MPSSLRQLVDGAFHGEGRLRGAVAAEAAARDHVGVDGVADALLVRAAIGGERARHRRGQGLAGVVAVGAGVGDHLDVERGERAVLPGAELDLGGHLVPRRGADELVLAGPLPFHRAAVELHAGEQGQVFGHHLLLAAEAAADALGEDVDLAGGNAHQVGELGAGSERALRAGAHVPAAVLALARRSSRASRDGRAARARSSRCASWTTSASLKPFATSPISPCRVQKMLPLSVTTSLLS